MTTERLILLQPSNNVRELQTIIRDKETSRSDFIFAADRLIRLVVEESLSHFPYTEAVVETPLGEMFKGLRHVPGNCGVSIVRSGEAMEKGLRACCKGIRIGKVLVVNDEDTRAAHVCYLKVPNDISDRRVILLYPVIASGNACVECIKELLCRGVSERQILLLSLFATPSSITEISKEYPAITILTSELDSIVPSHFTKKYFGTD